MKFIDAQGKSKEVRELEVVDNNGRVVERRICHTGNANYTFTTEGVMFHNVPKTVRAVVHGLRKKNQVKEYFLIPQPKQKVKNV